jgi:hypothetical protein
VLLLPLAGCGSLQARAEDVAEDVADRFNAALAASDWATGCRPRRRRPSWSAAGCTPVTGRPYECRLNG